MSTFPRLVRPGLHLTPYLCGQLADVLDLAINRFQGWGLRVRDIGRLHLAGRLLRKVAERGYLGVEPEELEQVAWSAALASDFHLIADTVSDRREEPIAKDIKVALGGTLKADNPDSAPYEYQSQYWVGVLLAQSQLRPAVHPLPGQPDYIVRIHDLDCGVEVKRPRSLKGAIGQLKDAADQSTVGERPGIIVIDASTIVGEREFVLPRAGIDIRAELHRRNGEVADQLGVFIRDYKLSDKFTHVMALMVFTRFVRWSSLALPVSDSGTMFSVTPFPNAYAGQMLRYQDDFQRKILRGIHRLNNNDRVRVTWKG
jgi:hypothetical protein